MLRRAKFSYYYDIYSILQAGGDINKMISAAIEHSDHKLHTRGLIAMLTNSQNFAKETEFNELHPVYDVSPHDIEEYLKQKFLEAKS